ncbi:MAG: acyl-CoA dehydrogenase [Bacteroidia bacterium]|nr:acyl-CoA dehydrogenase [Bacteroidia bacterium]MDW8089594.1 acyl-CoA dehydrogenase [Bacteroidia bacterium]
MRFDLSAEQEMVRQMARDFAQTELLPGVIERDERQEFPEALVRRMGDLGFMGLMVSPEYGGGGMDTVSYTLVMEELSKVDASASVIVSVQNSLVNWGIEVYGTDEQKRRYLPLLARGEWVGAFCLSEPEAGSDATQQRTTAVRRGDRYILNGTKNWITNGGRAQLYLVIAQTDPSQGSRGISAFLVERSWKGVVVGKKEDKLGIRGSDTHTIIFNDVEVPAENRLGPEGFGFKLAMKTLEGGRIGIAAQALGIAAGAYELALRYSTQRRAFGVPIAKHQAIAFKLANMATQIEAARLLCWRAAWAKDNQLPYGTLASLAKLYASRTAMWVTTEAIQIHGGYGYVKEYHVERLFRDAKITEIYEGTSEIQRLILLRAISKGDSLWLA